MQPTKLPPPDKSLYELLAEVAESHANPNTVWCVHCDKLTDYGSIRTPICQHCGENPFGF